MGVRRGEGREGGSVRKERWTLRLEVGLEKRCVFFFSYVCIFVFFFFCFFFFS